MASLQLQAVAAVLALVAGAGAAHSFEFHEATVEAIQLGFSNGTLTSTALVRFYLDQIGRLNPLLHAVIEVNPDALRQAKHADAERRRGTATGSLRGVPVLLKDNIATRDALNTTAGSLALLGSVVKRDAGVAARLRRAGAVVLGKASLSEWANFRPVEAGWSARGGQARNPYVLSSTPCGSSAGSGVAVAANMAATDVPDGVGRGARAGCHRRLRRARRRGHRSGIQVHPARRVHAVPKEKRAKRQEDRRPQWLLPRI
uniref:Amidase domain-containing protein n=1 Tax=Aegilops tauschii subsp. strangulata TaxID=200361 RepID=A0A453FZ18_AEGTS